jgi:Tfp pilus assembly protein PilN
MINLLPPEEKTIILLEKKKKIAIIFWFLILFFICCLFLILLSVKIYLQSEVESQRVILQQTEMQFDRSETKNFQGVINSANSDLKNLETFYRQKVYFARVLEEISRTLPQQLYLANLSVSLCAGENSCVKITLSGFSPTRENLFEFKTNLEKENNFKEIYFPSSNWVKPEGVDFSASFKIENR